MAELMAVLVAMGGIFGAILAIFLGIFLLGVFTLWLSGRMLSLPGATFGNAALASLSTALATFGLSFLLSVVPILGNLIGWIAGTVVSVLIIQSLFQTDGLKACFCLLLHWILGTILGTLLVFGGGISLVGIAAVLQ